MDFIKKRVVFFSFREIKMTPEEIALLPQSKKRKVLYKVAVSNDKEALKAWTTENKA